MLVTRIADLPPSGIVPALRASRRAVPAAARPCEPGPKYILHRLIPRPHTSPSPNPMAAPPPCRSLGEQCRALHVTLRIGSLEEGAASLDHEATWLLGHTQHITFAGLWEDDG